VKYDVEIWLVEKTKTKYSQMKLKFSRPEKDDVQSEGRKRRVKYI
jgi:hypothetical protein